MTTPNHPAVLTGLALGDALGAPWEPRAEDPQDVNPPGLREWGGDMVDGHLGPAGTTTDDTGMAAALARAMVGEPAREYIPDRVATEYLEWYLREKGARGIGGTIRASLERFMGTRRRVARRLAEGRIGNGTAMRVAPLGLRYWGQPMVLEITVRQDSLITHNSPEAVAGSMAVAGAVALAIQLPKKPPTARLLALRDMLRPGFRNTRTWWALGGLTELLGGTATRYRGEGEALERFFIRRAQNVGVDGDVTATVYTALLAAALTPNFRIEDPAARGQDLFRRGARLAVRMGGDTDTRAAITGAIIGAAVGREGLPPEWVSKVGGSEEFLRLDATLYGASNPFQGAP